MVGVGHEIGHLGARSMCFGSAGHEGSYENEYYRLLH